ncbi:G-D-S-L family lipolytic protein [Humibacillus sp. DSM 29435]|uniref:SGNH/GDSL hydrolase family protein n=1 Tax=Humibacillus sp. DSM 29435 TaxID=1869167 RepID=UPI000871B7D3|nr:SGNH/GDSL hydrolase family protein [Humibacillus sp. DSM 29435]OFE16198.1 G-D-S-L family lipolytic protein [Humibacillus sp. DSM 29435]
MSQQATPRVWTRYVAIGDSFTEGMCDDDPALARGGEFAGWADRLAAHLSEIAASHGEGFGYANLAVRGRKLADVVGPQLSDALALEPDLVSIVGGGNDILRPKADLDALALELEAAVARIRETGADVLMATPVDPADAPLVKATRGRAAIHSANIWSIAMRHDAHVIDQWGLRALRDWRMWSEDRIHMTSEGHRRVALAALEALGHPAAEHDWQAPLDPAPPIGRREALQANAQWAKEYVGPWVHRRLTGRSSGDTRHAKRPEVTPLDPS